MDPNKVMITKSLEQFVRDMTPEQCSDLFWVAALCEVDVITKDDRRVWEMFLKEGLIEEVPPTMYIKVTELGKQVVTEIEQQQGAVSVEKTVNPTEQTIATLGKFAALMDEAMGKPVDPQIKQTFNEWTEDKDWYEKGNSQVPAFTFSINVRPMDYAVGGRVIWQYSVNGVAFGNGYHSAGDALAAATKAINEYVVSETKPDDVPEAEADIHPDPATPPTHEEWAKYWEREFTEFVDGIWKGVGDGKPYDYPAQVMRYALDSHIALMEIWNEFGAGQYVQPSDVVKAVKDLDARLDQEYKTSSDFRTKLVVHQVNEAHAAYVGERLTVMKKIISEAYEKGLVVKNEDHLLFSKLESQINWAFDKRGGSEFLTRMNQIQARYELREDAIERIEENLENSQNRSRHFQGMLVAIRDACLDQMLQDAVFHEWVGQTMGAPETIIGFVKARIEQLKEVIEARDKARKALHDVALENNILHARLGELFFTLNDYIRALNAGLKDEASHKLDKLEQRYLQWEREGRKAAGLPVVGPDPADDVVGVYRGHPTLAQMASLNRKDGQ